MPLGLSLGSWGCFHSTELRAVILGDFLWLLGVIPVPDAMALSPQHSLPLRDVGHEVLFAIRDAFREREPVNGTAVGAALHSPPRCRHVSEISAHFLILFLAETATRERAIGAGSLESSRG